MPCLQRSFLFLDISLAAPFLPLPHSETPSMDRNHIMRQKCLYRRVSITLFPLPSDGCYWTRSDDREIGLVGSCVAFATFISCVISYIKDGCLLGLVFHG
ncbi:hypothetical protein CEXT_194491 [Caerostris extrusa]|uniref:Uncharacterized protein n=1 Tax=Caerostris extrusa TaxID=172846 RepID=A0AAV4MKG1_CAEEX|nr:hypothetical protein CEXT_194491 [Caerostris extrusa]